MSTKTQAPFDFASDNKLSPHIAALMQRTADARAGRGLISADGQTHLNDECRAIYDAGFGVLSSRYQDACRKHTSAREFGAIPGSRLA